jgi:hypothetical protein
MIPRYAGSLSEGKEKPFILSVGGLLLEQTLKVLSKEKLHQAGLHAG